MVSRRRVALTAALAMLALPSPTQAAFPGANGKIAFSSERVQPNQVNTFTINPDGTGLTNLGIPGRPAWSADGTKIAYRCGVICIANADGSNRDAFTATGPVADDPAWSPDGQRIVFSRSTSTACLNSFSCGDDIYVVNADGTGLTPLTTDAAWDYAPAWSPDGLKIAFTRRTCGFCEDQIYTINPDGTGLAQLTAAGLQYRQASWSPDGSKLAVASNHDGNFDSEIYIVNRDGSGKRRITYSSGSFIIAEQPAWSPDGERIAFLWEAPGLCDGNDCGNEIFTVATDGTDFRRVTNDRVRDSDPDWQPIPNKPPDCSSVGASRPVLTSPNHRLIAMTLDGATDPDGDAVTISVDGITQDEPVEGRGDSTSPDALDDGDGQVRIRAERDSRGDGRVYRIAFTATDGRGGSCSGTATVSVPRKKHKPAVDSAPPSYDSFAR
jgi:Tol biopolymer transport system component